MKESYPLLNEKAEEILSKEEKGIDNLIRKGFIVKVYSLLFIQLMLTFSFVFLSMQINTLQSFIKYHYWIYTISLIIPFVILIYFWVILKKQSKYR